MTTEVTVVDKCEMTCGTEVEVRYTYPHCSESVTDTLCFSNEISNCVACVDDHACPECGEESDLEVDLY